MKRALSLGLLGLLTVGNLLTGSAWANQKDHWWQFWRHNPPQQGTMFNKNTSKKVVNSASKNVNSASNKVKNVAPKKHWWKRK